MSSRVLETLMRGLGDLRYEPTEKRVRATLSEDPVVDTTRAMLVWEPRRVVPSYAVPAEDVAGELMPAGPVTPADAEGMGPRLGDPASGGMVVLDPSVPFAAHSTEARR